MTQRNKGNVINVRSANTKCLHVQKHTKGHKKPLLVGSMAERCLRVILCFGLMLVMWSSF